MGAELAPEADRIARGGGSLGKNRETLPGESPLAFLLATSHQSLFLLAKKKKRIQNYVDRISYKIKKS